MAGAPQLPRVTRDGRVLIPSIWTALAHAIPASDSEAAQQIARLLIEAGESSFPNVTASPEASSAPPDARHDGHPPANLLAETAGQVAVDAPPSAATDFSQTATPASAGPTVPPA